VVFKQAVPYYGKYKAVDEELAVAEWDAPCFTMLHESERIREFYVREASKRRVRANISSSLS
jgi:hypothetical protein